MSARPSYSTRKSMVNNENLMLRLLRSRCDTLNWFNAAEEYDSTANENVNYGVYLGEGACLNSDAHARNLDPVSRAVYWPNNIDPSIVESFDNLHANVGLSMSSDTTAYIFNTISPLQDQIVLHEDFALPIKDSLAEFASDANFDLKAGACLVKREKLFLVWGETCEALIEIGTRIEHLMLGTIWDASTNHNLAHASMPSNYNSEKTEKTPSIAQTNEVVEEEEIDESTLDEEALKIPPRPTVLIHSVTVTLGMMLVVIIVFNSIGSLLRESRWDGVFIRMALAITLLPQIPVSAFFFLVIVGCVFQMIGPLSEIKSNSKFYSSVKPKRYRHRDLELPHITIQMPVYKEGLKGVIVPTVESLLVAIDDYERCGGTATIFINDDGLQLVKPHIAEQRVDFYIENNIGYCSRPGHGVNGFQRRGKFKKASNMNYALNTSIIVEDKFAEIKQAVMRERSLISDNAISIEEEDLWYQEALDHVVKASEGKTTAGGNIRIGEILLIVDSDTRVPKDCLINAAMEMAESPEVGIIQHGSGVMQVVHNSFENGITYFTNLIYNAIEFNVGNGDAAPFVGHNAFLRWKAMQSVSFFEDGVTKFWSEDNVSEDFDMSLRLQIEGFIVRLATYHKGGFKEGVSLTVFDELARWEKYAYGCNEIVFHPLIKWPTRGPITPMFRKFFFSRIRWTSKITMIAYIGTYYALGMALPLSLLNYFLYGWLHGSDKLDQFYSESWKLFLPLVIVFNVASPISYAILQHRLAKNTFFGALWENLRWMPMLIIFFGGLSWHLLAAILAHTFSINMEWGTTAKELEATGYYVGFDRIVKGFKWMYLFMFAFCGAMIYLSVGAPFGWSITQPTTIVPIAIQVGCHMLLPIILGFNLF